MRRSSLARVKWQGAQYRLWSRRFASTASKSRVDFAAIDATWQQRWSETEATRNQWHHPTRGKAYVLPMFPYPSGTLHLGHLRVYTISDVLARFKQLQGYEVIHPIGWDAFGLPAENAALERGIHPETWTLQNIEAMKEQMKAMGGQWDWDREIRTCDPEFYKHTQHIFLMLHERGLAYQAESLVNYDPVDRTVLANEQVDANGMSWRSGAKVEKIMLKQWFLKIKEFQEPLLKDLDVLAENGNWPERVVSMQRNWLGRSEGTKLWFDVESENGTQLSRIDVFTTRADTLFGVQYIALSLNHPIVQECAKEDDSLRAFLDGAGRLPPDSKAGYLLQTVMACNPLSKVLDGFDRWIPIYVAPYVLTDYGSGAVMGVPGHDARDHAFWRTNAGDAPVRVVISSESRTTSLQLTPASKNDQPLVEKGFVCSDVPRFGGLRSDQAVKDIVKTLQEAGGFAERTEHWRLRDWLISRQRYWGTPIPIIHCNSCGAVPVQPADLPVRLPQLSEEDFRGKTGNPLAEHPSWKHTTCPRCGSAAERETDTMDTFMDSSWYFFRFLSPARKTSPVSPEKANSGMPVDIYVGGVEHAILHLLYARFISKFLATTPLWSKGGESKAEPFKRLITQGMVHGKTYSDPDTGRFLKPEEVDLSKPSAALIKATGKVPKISFEKMSKSKYNGVDPGATIAKYGADVTRVHMLFQAPVSDVLEWDETSITGVERWLVRVVRLSKAPFFPPHVLRKFVPPQKFDRSLLSILQELQKNKIGDDKRSIKRSKKPILEDQELLAALKPEEQALWSKTQETIASVTRSYSETHSLNTVVSDLMTLTNVLWDTPHKSDTTTYLKYYSTVHLLRMMAPMAPATAEECWRLLHTATNTKIRNHKRHPLCQNGGPSIFAFGFPVADLDIIRTLQTTSTCVFQLDGKKKFEVDIRKVPDDIEPHDQAQVVEYVFKELLETESGREWLSKGEGKLWKASGTHEPDQSCPYIPKGWKAVVPQRGRLVNVVSPRKSKAN